MPTPEKAARRSESDAGARFSIDVHLEPGNGTTLAGDVRAGLGASPKRLPSKYFYDERGSKLFDAICELPEYYLTRAEQALLDRHAREILADTRPSDLIELGSGTSRKTRTLLEAAGAEGLALRYHPFDVCEEVLRASGPELTARYPWLEVHAIVGDYERHLDRIPAGTRRLVAFLGSTLGNYDPAESVAFVGGIARVLRRGELFLLGADLVKPRFVLEAAYDDPAGVTAEFNRNVLLVVNRELDADFDPGSFDHVAFFDEEKSQIEMHLRSRREQTVRIGALDLDVRFAAGETIHTEISRKFTREGLEALLAETGFALRRAYAPEDGAFALLLAERV